jgi:hypothetical protein
LVNGDDHGLLVAKAGYKTWRAISRMLGLHVNLQKSYVQPVPPARFVRDGFTELAFGVNSRFAFWQVRARRVGRWDDGTRNWARRLVMLDDVKYAEWKVLHPPPEPPRTRKLVTKVGPLGPVELSGKVQLLLKEFGLTVDSPLAKPLLDMVDANYGWRLAQVPENVLYLPTWMGGCGKFWGRSANRLVLDAIAHALGTRFSPSLGGLGLTFPALSKLLLETGVQHSDVDKLGFYMVPGSLDLSDYTGAFSSTVKSQFPKAQTAARSLVARPTDVLTDEDRFPFGAADVGTGEVAGWFRDYNTLVAAIAYSAGVVPEPKPFDVKEQFLRLRRLSTALSRSTPGPYSAARRCLEQSSALLIPSNQLVASVTSLLPMLQLSAQMRIGRYSSSSSSPLDYAESLLLQLIEKSDPTEPDD